MQHQAERVVPQRVGKKLRLCRRNLRLPRFPVFVSREADPPLLFADGHMGLPLP